MKPIFPLPALRWGSNATNHSAAVVARKVDELVARVNELEERLEDLREANNLWSGR